jgi:hypothetical protein
MSREETWATGRGGAWQPVSRPARRAGTAIQPPLYLENRDGRLMHYCRRSPASLSTLFAANSSKRRLACTLSRPPAQVKRVRTSAAIVTTTVLPPFHEPADHVPGGTRTIEAITGPKAAVPLWICPPHGSGVQCATSGFGEFSPRPSPSRRGRAGVRGKPVAVFRSALYSRSRLTAQPHVSSSSPSTRAVTRRKAASARLPKYVGFRPAETSTTAPTRRTRSARRGGKSSLRPCRKLTPWTHSSAGAGMRSGSRAAKPCGTGLG